MIETNQVIEDLLGICETCKEPIKLPNSRWTCEGYELGTDRRWQYNASCDLDCDSREVLHIDPVKIKCEFIDDEITWVYVVGGPENTKVDFKKLKCAGKFNKDY